MSGPAPVIEAQQPDPYIGVEEVAIEMSMSRRAVYEMLKRLGVPVLNGDRRMRDARFRRSAWEAARDAAERPMEPPGPRRPSYIRASAPTPVKAAPAPGLSATERLARLRKL